MITGNLVQPLPKSAQAAAAALVAGAGAVLGFLTSPGLAALGIVLIGGVAFAAALLLLGSAGGSPSRSRLARPLPPRSWPM